MLAIFFDKHFTFRLKSLVLLIFINLFCISHAQKGTILENITESDGLPSNYVFNIQEDHNHVLWLGTDKGLATYVDDKWLTLDVDNGMPGNYINKMVADDKNGLLISIYDKGLYFFNSNSKTLEKRYKEIARNQSVDLKKANKNDNYIVIKINNSEADKVQYYAFDRRNIHRLTKIHLLKKDNSLFFTLPNGIIISDINIFTHKNIYVIGNQSFEYLPFGVIRKKDNKIIDTISEENGLVSNLVSQIFKRKNGDIFFTTLNGGISILKDNNTKVSFLKETYNVRNIEYGDGKKYILADGYLYVLGKKAIEDKIFLRKDALTFSIEGNELILGSFLGLEFYNLKPKLKLIKTIPITIGISKIIKHNGKIVFSTYGNGIYVLDKNNLKNYRNQYFNNIENMFETKDGFAITSYEDGVSFLDKNFRVLNHFDKNRGLESNYATVAFQDNDTIYVGTKKGATIFYKNKPVFRFNSAQNFKGNLVRNIFRDKNGKIWVLTDKYLYKKMHQSFKPFGSIRLIDNKEDKILNGAYSSEKDELITISKNKFSVFHLDKIVSHKHVAPVILEKIVSGNKLLNINDGIQFSDGDKDIYFVFKSVDKEILNQPKLYYKINNDEWKPFAQPRALKFYHLNRGYYTLAIKAVNEDGYESYLKKSIKFKVTGPFYIRWWFILLSSFVISFLIYAYINQNIKKRYIKQLNTIRIKHQLENERKRIGRDLHDNIGAYVTSLISKIDKIKNNPNSPTSDEQFADARLDAEKILALLRQTIWILDNKETTITALYDKFKNYARKYLQTDNTRVIFDENIANNRKIAPALGSEIFRILQEALQNIHKHADATKVEVNVISTNKIIIYVKDNGKGFNNKEIKEGFGLTNMKERANEIGFKLNIYSDETGTTLEIYES